MTGSPPPWLVKGSAGKASARSGVKPAAKPKTDLLLPERQEDVFYETITPERAKELGDWAIENVSWPLKSTPFGVQAYALHKSGSPGSKEALKPARGYAYYMEQGLGKTKTTLADFLNVYNSGDADSLIVITVNSMKATWKSEMEEEDYPFDIHVWPDFKNLPDKTDGQVIIMNYEAIWRDGGKRLMEWARRGRPYIAFDESTALMNHASKQSKAGLELAMFSVYKRMLAGKPNPMGPHNLWPQLTAMGGNWGNFYAFRNAYCVMGGYQGRVITGQQNVSTLVKNMQPICFFADKKTWAPTLPDKKNGTLVCDMTSEQEKAYKTMAEELYAEVEGGNVVEINHTLHRSMKLQQIASGFVYGESRAVHRIGKGEPPKIRLIRDFLDSASGKTILFAHFEPTLRILMDVFPDAPFALSQGLMEPGQLEANKARFNSDDCMQPFIASSSVLKFGHTLIGTPANPCNNVVFVENTYSLLTRSQAEDRAHRWGATADSITYWDIICSPIDRTMVSALKRREDLAQALLKALKGYVDE